MSDEQSNTKTNDQKVDEEIIKNFDLMMNLEVLEEVDLWNELLTLVNLSESLSDKDALDTLESEK